MHDTKVYLPEKDLPTSWYNVIADLPFEVPPPINPGTRKPLIKDDLRAIFPLALIEQEMTQKRWIDIPDEVRDILKLWRPTPL